MAPGASMTPEAGRLGYWGILDVERFGPALSARIACAELGRRLPGVTLRTLAPLGRHHPVRADGGEPADALGPWGPDRAAELTDAFDGLVVAGELVLDAGRLAALYRDGAGVAADDAVTFQLDGLGPGSEQRCPVVWQAVLVPAAIDDDQAARLRATVDRLAVVSVRDEASRRRLEAMGVARAVDVVPDPVLIVGRHLPADLLQKRLGYLRDMGWYPAEGAPLVVHAGDAVVAAGPALARQLADVVRAQGIPAIVVAQLGPHEQRLVDSLTPAFDVPVFRLPPEAGPEDVVAAIAAGAGFVGTSDHAATVATAFDRPSVLLAAAPGTDLPGAYAEAVTRAASSATARSGGHALDAHFDRIATLLGRGRAARHVRRLEDELRALRRARAVHGEATAAERSLFADTVVDLEGRIAQHLAEINRIRRWGANESEGRLLAEAEVAALKGTRTFRWTNAARSAYSWARSARPGR